MQAGAGDVLIGASNLLAARSQMAFTLGFHILLVPFGVCLPLFTLIANAYGLRHDDRAALRLARRWSHAMGVTFAVGAVTGTVLSFELGILWPGMLGRFGDVFGLPFAIEGLAFFLEAIFVAIYIFGWDRSPPAPAPLARRSAAALRGAGRLLHHLGELLDEHPPRLSARRRRTAVRGPTLGRHLQPGAAARIGPLPARRAAVRRIRPGVDLCGRHVEGPSRSPAPAGIPASPSTVAAIATPHADDGG